MYCKSCGKQIESDSKFCKFCGTQLFSQAINQSRPVVYYQSTSQFSKPEIYAGFGQRLVAIFLDSILLQIVLLPISLAFMGDSKTLFSPVASLIGLIATWLYFALMESGTNQATLGKQVMNIKVTDLAGNRISFANATGRYFAKLLNTLTLFIGWLLPLFNEKKQGLHDILADTTVQRK